MKPLLLALSTLASGAVFAASPMHAQIPIPPLDVEIRVGTAIANAQSLSDGEPVVGIASGWVGEGRRPRSLEGTVRLATEGVINPYLGIHYRAFQEGAEDDVMRLVYGDYLLGQGDVSRFAASHRMRGLGTGVAVEPGLERNGFRPFVFGEITASQFDSRTSLAMELSSESELGSWYVGESRMASRTGFGWATGVGLVIPIGALEARPAIRYASAQAPVQSRTLIWEAGTDTSQGRGGSFDASGLEGQRIKMHHVEFSVGLSWGISR